MSPFFDDTPNQIATDPSSPGATPSGAYDALADLFLADDPVPTLRLVTQTRTRFAEPASSPTPRPHAAPLDVEALVLGHLPVLAGAWAAQHARSLADELGRPVALVRLTADTITLQVMGRRDELAAIPDASDLDEAISEAARCCARVLVRVDTPFELDLAAAAGVDRVCLLSGADDAAVVAAYRTLKGIRESIGNDGAPDHDEETPIRSLALRIMGADEADAEAAAGKIGRVSRAFLNCEIETLDSVARISAGSGRTLATETSNLGTTGLLAALREASRRAQPTAITDDTSDHTEPHTTGPGSSDRRTGPQEIRAVSLASRVGLRALPVTCPTARGIELALDEHGHLHLLGEGAASAPDLLAAEGWARVNGELLASLAGTDFSREPVVRILTETPARDRRLLDSRFRVDLVREVRLDDASTWCCVPLNADDENAPL